MTQSTHNQIEIDLPGDLAKALDRVGEALGITNRAEAAIIAIAEWTARRGAELDNLDPNHRYFVNEALDELIDKKPR
ncbi:MAG TPA: hypothetical protein VMV27_05800 [Candidatus Binataceae bacterium]|nr:hypothetical protein [Candidatus Binataceae bacterium]